jgi:hypothetical protein
LDALDFALFDLGPGLRAALVHHAGTPEDETEIYVDHQAWRHADVLPDVLQGLDIDAGEVSWQQEWSASALG